MRVFRVRVRETVRTATEARPNRAIFNALALGEAGAATTYNPVRQMMARERRHRLPPVPPSADGVAAAVRLGDDVMQANLLFDVNINSQVSLSVGAQNHFPFVSVPIFDRYSMAGTVRCDTVVAY